MPYTELMYIYLRNGIIVNEPNRTLNLNILVPEVITPGMESKLRFIHDMVCKIGGLFKQAAEPT